MECDVGMGRRRRRRAWRAGAQHGQGRAHGCAGRVAGPWVAGGAWGGRPAGRAARRGRGASPAITAHRPRTGLRIGWRRLAALAGDVLMVLTWAAMVPGMMWLGAAAGF
ncbi:hypothetical protein ABRZ08_11025 [Castellaniella ginsengisoli]|uniref:RDD domain-containing protein n=1 Tax=Castellaniella ginsengisoli TaxID=546114 RepID=A0AB39FYZ5_9BURK